MLERSLKMSSSLAKVSLTVPSLFTLGKLSWNSDPRALDFFGDAAQSAKGEERGDRDRNPWLAKMTFSKISRARAFIASKHYWSLEKKLIINLLWMNVQVT